LGGVEDLGIGCAVAPLAVHEAVRAEVNEGADFEILPGNLLRAGSHVDEVLRRQHDHQRKARKGYFGHRRILTGSGPRIPQYFQYFGKVFGIAREYPAGLALNDLYENKWLGHIVPAAPAPGEYYIRILN
jgi:hypothetical protein